MAEPFDMSQAQRERLAFLELRAYFTGELRRSDMDVRFGIKPAAASRDLAIYRDIAPGNLDLDYDQVSRCHRPVRDFKPVFEFNPDRVLAWLLQGFGDGLDLGLKPAAPCEGPGQLTKPDLEVLGAITRGICAKRVARISCLSLSSSPRGQEIVPVALADNGLGCHIRAFDRDRQRFGDFVLTRIAKVEELYEEPAEHELLQTDEQWSRIIEMELVPHPGVKQLKAIEADYGVRDGALRIKARAELAGYVVRRWSVDASPDHRLDPASHYLWLRNTQTLYGVESASLASGHAGAGAAKLN